MKALGLWGLAGLAGCIRPVLADGFSCLAKSGKLRRMDRERGVWLRPVSKKNLALSVSGFHQGKRCSGDGETGGLRLRRPVSALIKRKKDMANLGGDCHVLLLVRLIGLEPTRLTTPDPKSGAATNYATGAYGRVPHCGCKYKRSFFLYKILRINSLKCGMPSQSSCLFPAACLRWSCRL